MIAAIYARKSNEQRGVDEEAKSVTRQVEHARAFAEAKGWTVSPEHIFSDDGVSGAEFENRPGLQAMLAALKPRPPFQVLVMSEESRLGREQIETAYLLKRLAITGVRVFTYLDGREVALTSSTDKILRSVKSFASEVEREQAQRRVYDALTLEARAGYAVGGVTYGYTTVRIGSHAERRIVREEAEVIRRIFAMTLDGKSPRKIAAALQAEGIPAPHPRGRDRVRRWRGRAVAQMLRRDLYRGVITWAKTQKRDPEKFGQRHLKARPQDDWVQREVPDLAIVDAATWEKVQRILRGRGVGTRTGRVAARVASEKYLLSGDAGIARCLCGSSLTVFRLRGSGRYAYKCTARHLYGETACKFMDKSMLMKKTDRAVLSTAENQLLSDEVIEGVVTGYLAEVRKQANGPQSHPSEVAVLERKVERLVDAIENGTDPVRVLSARLKETQAKLDEARRVAAEAKSRPAITERTLARLEALLRVKFVDRRRWLRTHPEETKTWLRGILVEPFSFEPAKEAALVATGKARDGLPVMVPAAYEFKAKVALDREIRGFVAGTKIDVSP